MIRELKTDKEFKELLPSLTKFEYLKLEEQIKKDGVQTPIIIWNDTIVDGYNRYTICKENGISFPIREVRFTDRDDVKVWILKHQLGKRNLSEGQKINIAVKYERQIIKEAKKRKEQKDDISQSGFHHSMGNVVEPKICIAEELAKIAGVPKTSVERFKYIQKHGDVKQNERLIKGGREPDGRNNSVWAIYNEIREAGLKEAPKIEPTTMVCKKCGKTLPIDKFYKTEGYYRHTCKECKKAMKAYKSITGKEINGSDIAMTEEELKDYLYNENKEINYTIDDLLEEIYVNGKNGISSIQSSLEVHNDLLSDVNNKTKIKAVINAFIKTLANLVKE